MMSRRKIYSLFLLVFICLNATLSAQVKYEADWESLNTRVAPSWFADAKFGLFVRWGLYSVPAYQASNDGFEGLQTEWYGPDVMYKPWRNDNFHVTTYGEAFSYRDFAGLFKAELWNPRQWADVFARSGAKYVILTAKHHDGYCLWNTKDTLSQGWNSMTTGPQRDILREFSQAVTSRGMKFGAYYSLLEWETTRTSWPLDQRYAAERTGYYVPREIWDNYHIEDSVFIQHLHFQLKELCTNYKPDLLYVDGAWDHSDEYWKSREFLVWLYNRSPNKRNVLVNEHWGNNIEGKAGDYISSGYSSSYYDRDVLWENSQGLGQSLAYNRNENIEEFKSTRELIELLARTVCKGGNLLVNVGPTSDGRIPLLQQQRLIEIGNWLEVNGKAIYKTRPEIIESNTHTFTSYADKIYAFQYEWTQGSIHIPLAESISIKNCKLLGHDSKVVWKRQGPDLLIIPPVISPDNERVQHVYVFELTVEQN